jgi:hypothetical protein
MCPAVAGHFYFLSVFYLNKKKVFFTLCGFEHCFRFGYRNLVPLNPDKCWFPEMVLETADNPSLKTIHGRFFMQKNALFVGGIFINLLLWNYHNNFSRNILRLLV